MVKIISAASAEGPMPRVNRDREAANAAGWEAARHTLDTGHPTRLHRFAPRSADAVHVDWCCEQAGCESECL